MTLLSVTVSPDDAIDDVSVQFICWFVSEGVFPCGSEFWSKLQIAEPPYLKY